MNAAQLEDVVLGLEENDLLHYSHMLTGYIGNPELCQAIMKTLTKLRSINKDLYDDTITLEPNQGLVFQYDDNNYME
jgi:pyridoxal/pyridoxine/pyridoxamine kinase